jgi:hypothetical protein
VSTKKVSEEAPRSYKKLLVEALALRSQGGKTAYKRAKILTAVFSDQDFRLDNGNVDDFGLAAVLDQYVDDLLASHPFLLLKAMLEYCPDESKWEEGKLGSLAKEMREAGQEPQREVKRRHKITLEQYAEIEEKFKREQTRVKQLQKENAELRDELDKAQKRLKRLERGVAA